MSHTKPVYPLLVLSSALLLAPLVNAQPVDFDAIPPVIEDNILPEDDRSVVNEALPEEIVPDFVVPTIHEKFHQPSAVRDGVKSLLATEPKALLVHGQTITLRHPARVQKFYQSQDYPVIWTENHLPHAITEIYTAIHGAEDDALPSNRYHADVIGAFYENPETFTHDLSALEIVMSDAFLTLAGDLANGLVNPKETQKEWNAPTLDDEDLGVLLADAVNDGDIHRMLESINSNNPRYQALKALYKQGKQQHLAQPESLTITLRLGDEHPEVLILREKLGLPADSSFFDENLQRAVIAYQKKHRMGADGIVGKGTRTKLNGHLAATISTQELNLLRINMERQRWLPQVLGEKYILVNIPSYNVKLYQDGEVMFNEPVVIGRSDRETPAFVDAMRNVVMSPTWTVPPTILKDKRETGVSDAYDLIAPGGKIVKPSEFGGTIPQGYALRMPAGPSNPLGKVKFLFPNKHAIYLHDTPASGAHWGKAKSSGCVRIRNAEGFANLLLQDKMSKEQIARRMNPAQQKREYGVSIEPIPIYLVYWTRWSNPEKDAQIHKAKDVYRKDTALIKQYQSALQRFAHASFMP